MILFCSVCFQGADPVMRESLNAGIFVLLGITAVVFACFAVFFVRLAQRARTAAPLVEPEMTPLDDLLGSMPPMSTLRR